MVTMTLAAPGEPPLRWPALREDLELHHGPALDDGQPSWTLHDPVRYRYLRIDWVTHEVLRRWWIGSAEAIAEQVNRQTTLSIDSDHVMQVLAFARQHALLEADAPDAAAAERGLRQGLTWLLHHYLFFRVPLFSPDALLRRLLPWMRLLGGRGFTTATRIALIAGVVAVLRDADAFTHQALDLMSWRGALLYGAMLVTVKVAHEFGHAFVARHHGCRVPTMGVAFMVLWPVAYTDTSDVWRLSRARARLQVALAGVRTELSIAAWATLAWALLPDGPWRTAAFIVGTLTWVTTLLVNLSPFMRFDGYFALCDAFDQPNLHERSFAVARWQLRRLLLGWDAPAPEPLSARTRRAMTAFALATWTYRLMLYLGIAWLVYHFAFKAVGIVLFVVEIGWFIALPLWREISAWHRDRAQWLHRACARWRIAMLPLLVAAAFVPIPSHESAGAVLQPARHVAIRLPSAALIQAVHVQPGQTVAEGAPLIKTAPAALLQRLETAEVRARQLQAQVAAASVDLAQQSAWGGLQQALATAHDEVQATQREIARFTPTAPFAGTVLDIDMTARPGFAVGAQQVLLQMAATDRWRIVAYASETAARVLSSGQGASFVADAAPLRSVPVRVVSVAPHPSSWLGETVLAQAHGGAVEATQQSGHWWMTQPLYRVELEPASDPGLAVRQWRGHVVLPQPARSVWQRVSNGVANVAVREFGF